MQGERDKRKRHTISMYLSALSEMCSISTLLGSALALCARSLFAASRAGRKACTRDKTVFGAGHQSQSEVFDMESTVMQTFSGWSYEMRSRAICELELKG